MIREVATARVVLWPLVRPLTPNLMETETKPTFRFVEFNPRRAQRGAEAARVEVTYPEDTECQPLLLWMSPDDIMENIETFGDSPELQKALAAYQGSRSNTTISHAGGEPPSQVSSTRVGL